MKTTKYWKINMIKIDPGAIGFTSGFSQDSISITVGEQITIKQLIQKRITTREKPIHRILPAARFKIRRCC